MKTIGVSVIDYIYVFGGITLKRDLLYFDKILFTKQFEDFIFENQEKGSFFQHNYRSLMQEFEAFGKHGLVDEVDVVAYWADLQRNPDEWINDIHFIVYRDSLKTLLDRKNELHESDDSNGDRAWSRFTTENLANSHAASRAYSAYLNATQDDQFLPIIYGNENEARAETKSDVTATIKVVLKKFPILPEDIELDRLIDFKKNDDANLKLLRLRDWTTDITAKNLNEKELTQKLEYLLKEYTDQLDLYRMRYSTGLVETVIVNTLDLIGNAVSFQWGKAAKVLFDINRHDLILSDAEKKAVGKEVAYIHKANEAFGRT